MNDKNHIIEDFKNFKKLKDRDEQYRVADHYTAFNCVIDSISNATDKEIIALTCIAEKIYDNTEYRTFEYIIDQAVDDYYLMKKSGQITENDIYGKDLSLKELKKFGL